LLRCLLCSHEPAFVLPAFSGIEERDPDEKQVALRVLANKGIGQYGKPSAGCRDEI